jgi:Ca-activated chloride channel homolog
MKREYEQHRDRLTPREKVEIWDRIIEKSAGSRMRPYRRLVLVASGALAIVLLFLIVRPQSPPRLDEIPGREEARSTGSVQVPAPNVTPTPDGAPAMIAAPAPITGVVTADKMGSAARGGDHPTDVTTAHPAAPSRAAAVPAPPPTPDRAVAPATPPATDRTTAPATPPVTDHAMARAMPPAADRARIVTSTRAGTITGTVTDSTGRPFPYVNVLLVGTSFGAVTDDHGEFTMREVPPGTYTIRAAWIGADNVEARTEVRVAEDSRSAVALTLRIPFDENPAVTQLLSRENAETGPGARSLAVEAYQPPGEGGARTWGGILHEGRKVAAGGVPAPDMRPSPSPPVYPITGRTTLPNDDVYDSMYFEHYGINPFIPADEDSLSTFAVDVDAASYTVARRYIDLGHLPPKEAVRVEEFVNYFRQGYDDFTDTDFRIYTEAAPSPFRSGYQLLRIGLKARSVDERDRHPASLTFVIDCSGSMQREDRLDLVKEALRILIDRLDRNDTIGIVMYRTDARIVLDPTSVEEDEGRERVMRAIEHLDADGSTNAEEGLLLGYKMARRSYRPGAVNRIILCTDGVANVGSTGSDTILERVRREADRGIDLTAVGFGMGNYNDVLLEQLADHGDGNYYYVDRLDEARRIFIENLTGTLQTVARDAKVQVEFDPGRVLRYRLLGFENREVADGDFRNDKVDAGEVGAGHEVTALYELKLAKGVSRGTVATIRLRYARPAEEGDGSPIVRELASTLDARDIRERVDAASPRFRLDAAVAEFAEILRRSFYAEEREIRDILPLARSAAEGLRSDPEVRDFLDILERSADLSDKLSPEERESMRNGEKPWEYPGRGAPDREDDRPERGNDRPGR